MSIQNPVEDTSSTNSEIEAGTPVLSTTPTGTPTFTPAPLRPIRSSYLRLSAPSPAPTRHPSLAQEDSAEANNRTGQHFGKTHDHRASSISAISALTISPYEAQNYDRGVDHFEMSSEDEDQGTGPFRIHEDTAPEASSAQLNVLDPPDTTPREWYSTPRQSPASPKTSEGPTSPRNAGFTEVALAGVAYVSSNGRSSFRGVQSARAESVKSRGSILRHSSVGTAANGERRGSEAKNWEEVHAARRDAAAEVKVVDLTNAARESDQGSFKRHPSNSTGPIKSPPSLVKESSIAETCLTRFPSTSTRAMKSPHPEDDLATPTTISQSQISPTGSLNRYPSHSTKAMKSPRLQQDDLSTPKSLMSIASATTSRRAERGLNVPFLPRLLRLATSRTSHDSARGVSNADYPVQAPPTPDANLQGSASSSAGRKGSGSSSGHSRRGSAPVTSGGEPLKLVFEADDNDDYDGDAGISNATTATTVRPKVVRHSTSARDVIGLQEMLKAEPTTSQAATGVMSPTKSKVGRFLGENVRFGAKRGGIVGMPDAREAEDVPLSHMDPIGLGIDFTPSPAESYRDGLRLNPVRRAATLPVKRERRVTFPPPPVDVAAGMQAEQREREIRETIVSTPYPLGYKNEEHSRLVSLLLRNNDRDILTLVIYSSQLSNRLAKVKQIVLPGPQESVLVDDSHSKKPEIRATIRKEFDDHALIKLLLKSYKQMRGPFLALTSARIITCLRLVSYSDSYQLRATTSPPPLADLRGDDITPVKLQALFESPKSGRKKHELTTFISELPNNTAHDRARYSDEKVAIQFVEGWAVRRIILAVITILLLSILATVLWITLGVGASNGSMGDGSGDTTATGSTGYMAAVQGAEGKEDGRGEAGARLEGGVLLGLLVLVLGWTGVGGWVGLSWVVG